MGGYNLTAFRNSLKNEQIGEELPDKRQSYSLDSERNVACDQKLKKTECFYFIKKSKTFRKKWNGHMPLNIKDF